MLIGRPLQDDSNTVTGSSVYGKVIDIKADDTEVGRDNVLDDRSSGGFIDVGNV